MTDSYCTVDYWFPKSCISYGFTEFLAVRDLRDTSKGFLVDDALFIESKMLLLAGETYFILLMFFWRVE